MQAYQPTAEELIDEVEIPTGEKLTDQLATDQAMAPVPAPKFSHGVEHIKSRLILAATAWNNAFGYNRKVNILTTLFISDNWSKISEQVNADVLKDAADMNEVMWKPSAYLVNELVTGSKDYAGKVLAAVLTTGEYVYLTVKSNNFHLLNAEVETIVPATKVIMIRETGATPPASQSSELDDSKYVRPLAPQGITKPRYAIKDICDSRHDRAKISKRRKANKTANKQRAKCRK